MPVLRPAPAAAAQPSGRSPPRAAAATAPPRAGAIAAAVARSTVQSAGSPSSARPAPSARDRTRTTTSPAGLAPCRRGPPAAATPRHRRPTGGRAGGPGRLGSQQAGRREPGVRPGESAEDLLSGSPGGRAGGQPVDARGPAPTRTRSRARSCRPQLPTVAGGGPAAAPRAAAAPRRCRARPGRGPACGRRPGRRARRAPAPRWPRRPSGPAAPRTAARTRASALPAESEPSPRQAQHLADPVGAQAGQHRACEGSRSPPRAAAREPRPPCSGGPRRAIASARPAPRRRAGSRPAGELVRQGAETWPGRPTSPLPPTAPHPASTRRGRRGVGGHLLQDRRAYRVGGRPPRAAAPRDRRGAGAGPPVTESATAPRRATAVRKSSSCAPPQPRQPRRGVRVSTSSCAPRPVRAAPPRPRSAAGPREVPTRATCGRRPPRRRPRPPGRRRGGRPPGRSPRSPRQAAARARRASTRSSSAAGPPAAGPGAPDRAAASGHPRAAAPPRAAGAAPSSRTHESATRGDGGASHRSSPASAGPRVRWRSRNGLDRPPAAARRRRRRPARRAPISSAVAGGVAQRPAEGVHLDRRASRCSCRRSVPAPAGPARASSTGRRPRPGRHPIGCPQCPQALSTGRGQPRRSAYAARRADRTGTTASGARRCRSSSSAGPSPRSWPSARSPPPTPSSSSRRCSRSATARRWPRPTRPTRRRSTPAGSAPSCRSPAPPRRRRSPTSSADGGTALDAWSAETDGAEVTVRCTRYVDIAFGWLFLGGEPLERTATASARAPTAP